MANIPGDRFAPPPTPHPIEADSRCPHRQGLASVGPPFILLSRTDVTLTVKSNLSIGLFPIVANVPRHRKQKTDVTEYPAVFNHVGLLVNEPPARASCSSSIIRRTYQLLYDDKRWRQGGDVVSR